MTDKAETIHDANAAFAAGNFQKTVLICGRILELQPQDYWASLTLGNAHERLGNRSEAARAWRQATECSVDYKIGAYHYLLRQEFSDQDFSNVDLLDDALSLALESNQKRWHYAPLLFLSGVRYIAAGDFPAADRNIEAAYKFYRDLDEGSLLFGWIIERLESLSDIALYPQLVYLVRSARARRTPVSYPGMKTFSASARPLPRIREN
jgi:tetratricopeptide (TPR) repeat protein